VDSRPVGVLGGSFNPPHVGHLAIASDACAQLDLEQVVFVPAGAPPHKDIADDVPAAARLAMTRLAVEGDDRFSVSSAEIDLGLRFTSDTLAEFKRRYPDRTLSFIAGSDTLLQFSTWHEPAAILELAHLVVAPRPGDDLAAVAREAARWGAGKVLILPSITIGVSSSMIRERVRAGRPIRYLVPRPVERFIADEGLYGPGRPLDVSGRPLHGSDEPLMSERQRAERFLRQRGLSAELEAHCRATALQAERLARRWGAAPDDAFVAGLLHDVCRELGADEVLSTARRHGLTIDALEEEYPVQLLHARVAAAEATEAGFAAPVAEAICRHTLGGPRMTVLDECLFVADATAPGRTWKGVDEVRRQAMMSLDAAALTLVARDIDRLRARGREPHPLMLALYEEKRGTRS
jgi:nicotinate-nucleotide adenylyltransferase